MDKVRILVSIAPLGPWPRSDASEVHVCANIGGAFTTAGGEEPDPTSDEAQTWRWYLTPWNLVPPDGVAWDEAEAGVPSRPKLHAWWRDAAPKTVVEVEAPPTDPAAGLGDLKAAFEDTYIKPAMPADDTANYGQVVRQIARLGWTAPVADDIGDIEPERDPDPRQDHSQSPRIADLAFYLSTLPGGTGRLLGGALDVRLAAPTLSAIPAERRLFLAPEVFLPNAKNKIVRWRPKGDNLDHTQGFEPAEWEYEPTEGDPPAGHEVVAVIKPFVMPATDLGTSASDPIKVDWNTFWVDKDTVLPAGFGAEAAAQEEIARAMTISEAVQAVKLRVLERVRQPGEPDPQDGPDTTALAFMDILAAAGAAYGFQPFNTVPSGNPSGTSFDGQRRKAIESARLMLRTRIAPEPAIRAVDRRERFVWQNLLAWADAAENQAGRIPDGTGQPDWLRVVGAVGDFRDSDIAGLHHGYWSRLIAASGQSDTGWETVGPKAFLAGGVPRAEQLRRARLRAVLWAEAKEARTLTDLVAEDLARAIAGLIDRLRDEGTGSEDRPTVIRALSQALVARSRGGLPPEETVALKAAEDLVRASIADVRGFLVADAAGTQPSDLLTATIREIDALRGTDPETVRAGAEDRGIVFTYGKPITFIDQAPAAARPELTEAISGFALFVRREASDQPWRLVTAGELAGPPDRRPANGDPDAPLDETTRKPLLARSLVPVPQRITANELSYRPELTYSGRPLGVSTPISGVLAGAGVSDQTDEVYRDVDIVGYRAVPAKEGLKAPILRYGDNYRAAIAALGPAGGMPAEIAGVDTPRQFDEDALDTGFNVPLSAWSAPYGYRCTYPVGEVTLVPPSAPRRDGTEQAETFPDLLRDLDPAQVRSWPSVPEGVRLLVDDMDGDGGQDRQANLLLARADGAFRSDAVRRQVTVALAPPVAPITVVERWLAPAAAATADERAALIARIKESHLAKLRHDRARASDDAAPLDQTDPALRHPAVGRIYLRLRTFDGAPAVRAFTAGTWVHKTLHTAAGETEPDSAHLYKLTITATDRGNARLVPGGGPNDPIEVRLPPGTAALVDIAPAIATADAERFATSAKRAVQDLGDGWCIFPASTLALETPIELDAAAWTALVARVHAALDLVRSGRQVTVALDRVRVGETAGTGRAQDADAIGEATLLRQTWFWRGAPLAIPRQASGPGEEPDWLTDADGTPPPDLFASPDAPEDPVVFGVWEELIAPSESFRTDELVRIPWNAAELGPLPDTADGASLLANDGRRNLQSAGYARYGLRLTSRYAPVLAEATVVSRVEPPWRRIYIGYDGDAPPAPAVLSIMPLIAGIPGGPVGPQMDPGKRDAAPVLAYFAHAPFREFGMTERLTARLVEDLVDGERDTPDVEHPSEEEDDEAGVAPYRSGADPHVHGETIGDPYWGSPDTRTGLLRTWGPFATTFDISDTEPGIGGCLYVVFPPENAAPHWFADIIFERAVLRPFPDETGAPVLEAPPGLSTASAAPRQIHFLPLSHRFEADKISNLPDLGEMRIRRTGDTIALEGLEITETANLRLDPLRTVPERTETHRALLMVSRLMTESISRQQVPVPVALFTLVQTTTGVVAHHFTGDPLPSDLDAPGVQLVATQWLVRIDTRRGSDWAFDPWYIGRKSMRDFFRSILPVGTDRGWVVRDFHEPADARAVIQEHHGPFAITLTKIKSQLGS